MPARRLLALGIAAAVAAGCGSSSGPEAPQVTTSVASAGPPGTAQQPSDGTPPVGQQVPADDADGTGTAAVLAFRQPLPARFPPDRKGYEYAGIEVKRCFTTITAENGVEVGWEPWTLVYKNGNIISPPSSWSADHFSVALYPRDRPVKEGQCVRGWIPYEVRKGSKPTTVTYLVDDADPHEWTIS